MTPYALDAALLGPVRRPRLYWSSFRPHSPDITFEWDKKSSIHRGRLLAPVERGLLALESKDVLEVVAFDSERNVGRYSELSNSYVHIRPFDFSLPLVVRQRENCIELPEILPCNSGDKAIMACKALLMNDMESFEEILASTTPEECRRIGRNVKNFDQKPLGSMSGKYSIFSYLAEISLRWTLSTSALVNWASTYS